MIPDVPLLQRKPLRSGLTDATYDPRLMLMKLGQADIREIRIFEDTFAYNASLVHEWMHWFHHHATTFGVFLNALRISQQTTTLRMMRNWSKDKVQTLFRLRDAGERPILSFNSINKHPIFDYAKDKDLGLFQQIWYDHQWVYAALEGDAAHSNPGPPDNRIFGEIISDVTLSLIEAGFTSASDQDVNEQRRWYTFCDETPYVAYNNVPVTTRMIMETAATISELDLLPHTIHSSVLPKGGQLEWEYRIKLLLEGSYGVPFRFFLSMAGVKGKLSDILPTLGVVCFVALNPPLPPFVMGPPANADTYKWSEIYPPLRFVLLTNVVAKVGLLPRWSSAQLLSQYITDICDAALLESPLNYQFPKRDPKKLRINFSDETLKYSSKILADCHDYAFWVQEQLSQERLKRLPLFVSVGQCLSGEQCILQQDALLGHLSSDAVPYFDCPLHWTNDNKLAFRCPVDFGNWLMLSSLIFENLFDLVVGSGEIELANVPDQVAHSSSYRKIIKASIERAILEGHNV